VTTVDVAALGEPLCEFNQQPDGRFLPGFGGDTSNVVIAAARLGARTAYISRLGADIFGEAIRKLWASEGVDATAVTVDHAAPTGLYFVTHGARGHEFTYRRAGSAASLMTPKDVPPALIASARFLHVSGISQAISRSAADSVAAAVAKAKASGTRVSFDTNFRSRLWSAAAARAAAADIAPYAHVLKTSIEDAEALTGLADPAAIARRFLDLGAATVLVTLGREGVLLATVSGSERISGFGVNAVDATGAGDAFTGAFLAELSLGRDPAPAARFANAAAALSTLGYGAIAPLPRRPAVEAFLKEIP
jgi:2-dehydro-3-deoxygluconokinase